MKIGFWAKCLADKHQKTGIQVYAENILKSFAKIDRENQYIVYSHKPIKYDFLNQDNIRLKVPFWPFPTLWTQIRVSIDFALEKGDLLFLPAFITPIFSHFKTVVMLHDLFFLQFPKHYNRFTRNSFAFWTKIAFKRADKIIVPSKYVWSEIKKYFPEALPRVCIIYEGYSPSYKQRSKDEIKKVKVKYQINSPYFIHVAGLFTQRKNTHNLIKAFYDFKKNNFCLKTKLLLIGERSKEYAYPQVAKLINDLKLNKDVIFLGYLPKEDLAILLSGALAAVYPSLSEGFGLPALEAMAAGCSLITSNQGALKEIAKGAAILVDPLNKKELLTAMQKISDEPKLRERLIDKGFKRSKFLSWDKCAKDTLKLFDEVIKG